ncbi:MAG: hypothetical protein ACYS99_05810 [Planctomycetota bacterium]|jgi:hypothetical protein
MPRRTVASTIVLLLFVAACSESGSDPDDSPPPAPSWPSGVTIVPGTWTWDIDSDTLGKKGEEDLWWEKYPAQMGGGSVLMPKRGSTLALVEDVPWEDLDPATISGLELTEMGVPSGRLEKGAVLALRTSDGNLAKLRVARYHDKHDFSWDEAGVISDESRTFLRSRSDTERYHIALEWVLFKEHDGKH